MYRTNVAQSEHIDSNVGLPISWYFDPAILEIERRELFATGPRYVGHAGMVSADGDYAALGGQNHGWLLVHYNGRPQLVSNICRHRQALMLDRCGRAKHIVCPIHNWAYGLDGCQIAAPHFPQNPELDLPTAEVTEWNGLLFAGPRSVRKELAPLAGWTELAATNYVLDRVDEEEHDLNWKVYLEVYLEDYHIGAVHPGFRAFVDPDDLRGALQFVSGERFACEQINVRWPLDVAGSPKFAEFQRILFDVWQGRRPDFAAIWLCLFPGQLIEWYPGTMVVTTYTPLSPTRTRLRSEYFFPAEIAAARRDFCEAAFAVLDEVTGEDQFAAETIQCGRQALWDRGDDLQGPYQRPMEQGLHQFHECLRETVGATR
jgi:phenylpropionate dioxygenase-like ring-hydroxylating dioxygenase large terminal subunit